jgi:hypothetical protein
MRAGKERQALNAPEVEAILKECEHVLEEGRPPDLGALGFWRAVEAAKRHPEWTERFAGRIADVDRRTFLARVPLALPVGAGVALLALGALAGAALVAAAFFISDKVAAGIVLLLGAGALVGTTHDLAHLASGAIAGIRFTHFYSDLPRRPQPGVKIDYASYLHTPARARAWMHASGAIVTKLLPFLLVPVALAAATPSWTVAVLLTVGVLQLLTDVLFSLRAGDWKKFRREMRLARQGSF